MKLIPPPAVVPMGVLFTLDVLPTDSDTHEEGMRCSRVMEKQLQTHMCGHGVLHPSILPSVWCDQKPFCRAMVYSKTLQGGGLLFQNHWCLPIHSSVCFEALLGEWWTCSIPKQQGVNSNILRIKYNSLGGRAGPSLEPLGSL